jgi:sugar lactone lactonase YvrE
MQQCLSFFFFLGGGGGGFAFIVFLLLLLLFKCSRNHSNNVETGDAVGNGLMAQFKFPQALALTRDGNILVADTGNHRICRVTPAATLTEPGTVEVIAGTGVQGDQDGLALTEAKFAKPGGITVYYEPVTNNLIIIIADTNNHRIRKLDHTGYVTTLSGRRNQGPQQGYRDGIPQVVRFNFPRRVLADPLDGAVYVSDSYNHLIRRIALDGTTTTLTGNTETVTTDDKGCPPPCLKGVDGYRDGNLTYARFHQPNGLAWGMNGTLLVLDGHRLRRIEFRRGGVNTIQGVKSLNRVSTISGGAIPGKADGMAEEASYNEPKGVTMAADGRIYVADFVGSRIRRLTRAYDIAKDITCSTTGDSLVRPSGCTSYDVPTDATLNKGTAIAGNIHYNKGIYLTSNDVFSPDMYSQLDSVRDRRLGAGLRIRSCLGFPPPLIATSSSGATMGPRSGTTVKRIVLDEDAGKKTEVRVKCPSGCASNPINSLYGTGNYTDFSRVCAAAIQSGIIDDATGGYIVVSFTEGLGVYEGSTKNGVTSQSYVSVFKVVEFCYFYSILLFRCCFFFFNR